MWVTDFKVVRFLGSGGIGSGRSSDEMKSVGGWVLAREYSHCMLECLREGYIWAEGFGFGFAAS